MLMPRTRRWRMAGLAGGAAVGVVACLTMLAVVHRAAGQSAPPYVLQLHPPTPPVDEAIAPATDASGRRTTMRVCADPNNLPFSNAAGQGFENKLALLLASDLHLGVAYSWWPQRRGFVRNTLTLRNCDVVMGIASASELVLTTRPYYASTYVFLTRRDRGLSIRSLDDTLLRHLRIGVPLTGGDANPPPGQSLADRGLADHLMGYPLYGNYDSPDPAARIVHAVAGGEVDVAVVWGPLAGYYAHRERVPLVMTPVQPALDRGILPYVYSIALGVRHGDTVWRDQLQSALDRHRPEIDRLLRAYGVPLAAYPGKGKTEVSTR
jgi:mxaJ protein